jgi:membrane protease YdiL (CAAX protease family)
MITFHLVLCLKEEMDINVKKDNNLPNNLVHIIANAFIFMLASFLMYDPFGVSRILSVYALLNLLYPEQTVFEKISINISPKKRESIYWISISFMVVFLRDILVSTGLSGPSLIVKDIVFFPSYLVLLSFAIPLLWGAFADKDALKSFYRVDKTSVLALLLMAVPFVFSNLMSVWNGQLDSSNSKSDLIQLIFQLSVGAAIGEELLYRGLFYSILKKLIKTPWAMISSSFLFTISHLGLLVLLVQDNYWFPMANLAVIFLLGIINCIIYDKSKSLILSIAFHMFFNGTLMYVFALLQIKGDCLNGFK